jgi:epoxyqueuosine reductase
MALLSVKKAEYSKLIKQLAKAQGFDFCGISKAQFLSEEAPQLENWLANKKHGAMAYMEGHFDKRLDPRLLVPGAKSVISLLFNYYPPQRLPEGPEDLKISKYAYGTDYHKVIKDQLFELVANIKTAVGDIQGRVFVDSAPVMDKAWARRAGLGWIGKHSNLLNRDMGSFFFIAELICDLDLEPDGPMADYCGTCTRCIDACPTNAITAYQVDGSKCISYFTIELKEALPEAVAGQFDNWVFGCDICQDVCPWNRFSKPHSTPKFLISSTLASFDKTTWELLSEDVFNETFKGTALQRTGYQGLKRNINFVNKTKNGA